MLTSRKKYLFKKTNVYSGSEIFFYAPIVLNHFGSSNSTTLSPQTGPVKAELWIQIQWIWIRIQDFVPIWIPIRIHGYAINYEIKKIKNNFRKKLSLLKYIFLQQMSHKVSWATELLIYILHLLSPFYPFFYMSESGSVFWIRIRIHKAPEYGFNTDPVPNPDPQHWKSRSRTGLRNIDNETPFTFLVK